MPMPYQITTIGAIPSGSNFSSGIYAFDGAGDVKSIGSDYFLYDKMGRLTESTATQFAPGITKQYHTTRSGTSSPPRQSRAGMRTRSSRPRCPGRRTICQARATTRRETSWGGSPAR